MTQATTTYKKIKINQKFNDIYTGNFIPIAIAMTNKPIATIVFNMVLFFAYFKKNPRPTANTINNTDVVATCALNITFSPLSLTPANVLATISAKAATTRMENNQVNNRNNFLPNFPMYNSIM